MNQSVNAGTPLEGFGSVEQLREACDSAREMNRKLLDQLVELKYKVFLDAAMLVNEMPEPFEKGKVVEKLRARAAEYVIDLTAKDE